MAPAWRASGGEPACFAAGVAVLLAQMLSPLAGLADRYFVAHMGEHELLMAVAAPLLALSRPLGAMLWGLPARLRPAGAALAGLLAPLARRALHPAVATAVHGAVIWAWHAPPLFDAALGSEALHGLQHASFLATALLFWSALLDDRTGLRHGAAVFWLFLTAMHTGLLGAMLVFARRPWYASAGGEALAPMDDQQLAGLVMWVPGGLVYAIAALVACAWWIGAPARHRWSEHGTT